MTIQNLIRPAIKALKPYSSARDEFQGNTDNLTFLDANENPFDNGVNRYPDPQQGKLKALISQIKDVPTENILLGNGSDEVLDLLIRMFCEPNQDNILILPPTYGMYEVLANVNAVETLKINLSEETFQPKTEEILAVANANSKILFLCSPNNPSGNNLETLSIELLLKNFKGIVVIDEAYIDFSTEESWLSRLNEFPNLVVTQTLSKAFGMAGIRLGMCFASAEIIATLNKIKPPYNINQLTQEKAIEGLRDRGRIKSQIDCLTEQRNALVKVLKEVKFVKIIYPSEANFIMVKVDDANKRYQQLIENGIVIRNRTTQPLCENCLRLTVGTVEENKKLIENLKKL
ncbi:histidinol-phosphate transaminase [Gelidibacter maritimus]|uniref:Histidinol-phosphate aminotransferase n=1 Tax=Gelidibacter maritimus TaxID=2761487 RepID=A0A7W2M842_9FLAO|nr:histidinol-phosphate transaminase [Gelidibacter maritimus]MBA6154440.1 histidinol-phosphate transaminase [Gelidibacter maritimus]